VPFSDIYRRQVALLIRLLPIVAKRKDFALKGGTAINLFVRDMPRLSVDIDLTYLPVQPRAQSLKAIDTAMKGIAKEIRATIAGAQVNESATEGAVTTLYVGVKGAQVKIEVTPVLRGTVFEPELRSVSKAVEAAFGFAEMPIVSFADLYAGKIVAALDRQHPRDLFDIQGLLTNEGIGDELRRAFLIYLLSHDRPMHEVVAPRRKALATEFSRGFEGMTAEPVKLGDLEEARESLIGGIIGKMSAAHRDFLMAFIEGKEDWAAVGLADAAGLPAIKWRQQNLGKLADERRVELARLLSEALAGREQ
jgi:predicted nucleotidyltransferase component of viral defense system